MDTGFRNLTLHTRWLIGLLIANMSLEFLSACSSWLQLQVLTTVGAAQEMVDTATLLLGLVALLFLVAQIATLVVFAVWIVRAHRNLPDLGAEDLDVTPGWALGWFFVPIAFYWKPYQAMRTLLQASRDARRWKLEDVPWWLPAWWTLWTISNLLGQVYLRFMMGTFGKASDIEMAQLDIVSGAIGTVLSGFAILLVARIWSAQRAQRLARASQGPVSQLSMPVAP